MEASVIVEQNPWWKSPDNWWSFDKHLKQDANRFITFQRGDISFQTGSIYLILGPRQVGKTFWIKHHIRQLVDGTSSLFNWTDKKSGQSLSTIQTQSLSKN